MSDDPKVPIVRFRCAHCAKEVAVPARQAGQEIGCPFCRAVLLVPAAAGEVPAPAVQAATVPPASQPEARELPPVPVTFRQADLSEEVLPEQILPEAEPPPSPSIEPVAEPPAESVAGPAMEQAVVDAPAAREEPREAQAYAPDFARPVGPYRKSPPPARRGVRWLWVAAAAVVVLVVGVLVARRILADMAREQKARAVERLVQETQQALQTGDLDRAGSQVAAVETGVKELETLGGALTPAVEVARAETLQKIAKYRERLAELDQLGGKLAAGTPGLKKRLEDEKALYAVAGPPARALVAKLSGLLQRLDQLELQRRLDDLRQAVTAAEKTYLSAQVEAALEQVKQVRTRLAAEDRLKDPDLQKRLDRLREHGEQLDAARRVWSGTGEDLAGGQKKLAALAAKLDAAQPENAPVLAGIKKLQTDLHERERRQIRLTAEQLKELAHAAARLADEDPGVEVGAGTAAEGVPLRYENQKLRLVGMEKDQKEPRLVMDAGGYRCRITQKLAQERPGASFRLLQALAQGLREAGAPLGRVWEAQPDSPFPTAWSKEDGPPLVVCAGKLYSAEVFAPPVEEKAARDELAASVEALAKGIEQDGTQSEEFRQVVVTVVRGACKPLETNDFITSDFCRRVLDDGYLQRNYPRAAAAFAAQLARYRTAYEAFAKPSFQFKAKDPRGDELYRAVNYEDHAILWYYDRAADQTAFGIKHPVDDRPLLYVVYDFKGRHDVFPKDVTPLAVRMVHPAVGTMASYDPAGGKLDYDAKRWALGAALSSYPRLPAWAGEPQWAFPPHVVLLNLMGDPLGIVTPAGRVDLPHFLSIADLPARRAAQDKYLDELARVLNATGYLHLYFLYFHQYVLDSPIETNPELLGSHAHAGDIHQTVYQSLDRELGGHYLGDCDDLAELYMNVTRRQKKLSYVMSLPSHASCGWVEKTGDRWRLQFLDTGPPRTFEGADLEKVVETGSRTYDRDKTMRFDPKSVPFLFRFAGEPTRTSYWLSCRMFYDREYAEIMERVQSYWHFHFYALGIRTMEDKIAKGDRVPENCVELAGLYGTVREIQQSIHWTNEALKQLGAQDALSRLSEEFRIGLMHRQEHDFPAAYAAIKNSVAELTRLNDAPDWLRYVSQRLDTAGLLVQMDRPWDAWNLIRSDAERFLFAQKMRMEHAGMLTQIYCKMQEAARAPGAALTAAQKKDLSMVERALTMFYGQLCFEKDDDFQEILQKYGSLGWFYGGKYGHDRLLAELYKDGPYPAGERNHTNRANPEAEDWKWIRLSPLTYAMAFGDALDPDDPPEKWRREEGARLAVAMQTAGEHARKFGSLASTEFSLLTAKVSHAFLTKDWKEFEAVMQEVQRRNFARLTLAVAEGFGRSARFVTAAEFGAQYHVFSRYVDAKVPYFAVVYEAYRQSCYDHARAAARAALERWPEDEDMKREAAYLEDLIAHRRKEEAEKKPAPKAEPAGKKAAPEPVGTTR